MNDKIVNKVAAAGILRLDLRNYMPQEAIVALGAIYDYLKSLTPVSGTSAGFVPDK